MFQAHNNYSHASFQAWHITCLCDVSTIQCPSSIRLKTRSQMNRLVEGSICAVGSSKNITGGFPSKAMAVDSLRLFTPLYDPTLLLAYRLNSSLFMAHSTTWRKTLFMICNGNKMIHGPRPELCCCHYLTIKRYENIIYILNSFQTSLSFILNVK